MKLAESPFTSGRSKNFFTAFSHTKVLAKVSDFPDYLPYAEI